MDECEFADFGWLPCTGPVAPSDWTDGITVCTAHEGFVAGRSYEAHQARVAVARSRTRRLVWRVAAALR